MQAAGLRKLFLAVNSLKDSALMLGSHDKLNVVTFSAQARAMSKKMLPANAASIERTLKYLDKFTPESIHGNKNTNILSALDVSLALDPSVIVLITDGLPTASPDYPIEVNKDVILEAVREKNVNNAIIYVVALEVDPKRSPAAKLLVSLAEEHNGKIKVIDTDLLYQYAESEDLPE